MPRRKTSIKTTRKDKKKRLRNFKIKLELKKTLKKLNELFLAKNTAEAKALIQKVFSQLDKAAKKRIIHSKTADRKKSRLMKRLAHG
jgi:small subunit ribosomal protein S20